MATEHVDTCPECRQATSRTRRLLAAAERLDGSPVELRSPPDRVWDQIAMSVDASGPEPLPAAAPALSRIDPPRRRRTRRWVAVVAALVLGLVSGAGAAFALLHDDAGPSPAAVPVSSAELSPLEPGPASGSAELVRRASTDYLRVSLRGATRGADDVVEAWLLDPSTGKMVAIGVLAADRGTFAIPSVVDTGVYSSVDLSLEPARRQPRTLEHQYRPGGAPDREVSGDQASLSGDMPSISSPSARGSASGLSSPRAQVVGELVVADPVGVGCLFAGGCSCTRT